ncbi:MAG: hypothetical protein Fur0041_12720 [Bacteroidia bacterium]
MLVLFSGCRKDNGPSWDTGWLFPVGHGTLTIDQLIADSLTTFNGDGGVRVAFEMDLIKLDPDTLFKIPDTTISNVYHIPAGSLNLNPGDYVTPNLTEQTTYAINDIELVYGRLKTGKINVKLQNDIMRRIVVRYEIPSANLNGDPFDTSFVVPAATSATSPTFYNTVLDLSGYEVNFTGIAGDRVNTLVTRFSAQIDPTETGIATLLPQDTVAAIMEFTGVKPSYARGYFGSVTQNIGPEETGFELFQKIQSGTLGLDSLTMSLIIKNYVGMDARMTLSNVWSRNSRTGNTVYLNHSVIGSPINVNRATYSWSYPPVTPQIYSWTLDNSNSNAKALIENLPDYLGYNLQIQTNPLGNVSGSNDFLYSDYTISAALQVNMPLAFYADRMLLIDTIETDFSSVENKENILSAGLHVYTENGFPFEAGLQLYLLDAGGNITDSIVAAPGVIASAPLVTAGTYYRANGFTSSEVKLNLNFTQTQALLNATRIVSKVIFDTHSTPDYVKVFNTDKLNLRIAAELEYHIEGQ